MSLADVMTRVTQIQQQLGQVATPAVTTTPTTSTASQISTQPLSGDGAPVSAAGSASFTTALAQAQAAPAASAPTGSGAGARVLAWAESQIGQAEQPPGSNDGPAIATYRSAVAGSAPGEPWCAYFASWAASQAGTPLGDSGQGIGWVDGIRDWAQRNGKLLPAGSTPQPGDLILYGGRHVGIVESVNGDGSLTTVEGNEGDAVRRVHRSPSEATGYVRL
jgi:CHAP domain